MENINLLPSEEYKEVENRAYINPNLPVEQTNEFIDRFRETQKGNTAEIAAQTEALGTTVPSSEGGLMGAGSYWTSRYQTPQTNTVAQNLRTAAQASALNEALANEQAMWKQRYNQAYRDYQMRNYRKSERDRNRMYNTGNSNTSTIRGGVDYNDTTAEELTAEDAGGYVSNKDQAPGSSRMSYSMNGYIYTEDTLSDGRKVISNTDDPNYVRANDGYFYKVQTTDSWGPFSWSLSDEDRQNRANNLAQLEKIRYYSNQ